MCREGAWAELAAEVTFMVGIQSRMPGFKQTKEALIIRLDDQGIFII